MTGSLRLVRAEQAILASLRQPDDVLSLAAKLRVDQDLEGFRAARASGADAAVPGEAAVTAGL
jgi:hypothetical protein